MTCLSGKLLKVSVLDKQNVHAYQNLEGKLHTPEYCEREQEIFPSVDSPLGSRISKWGKWYAQVVQYAWQIRVAH